MFEKLDSVYLLDTAALGFRRAVACYLVKDVKTAILDTGYASSLDNVYSKLQELGVQRLDYIIPTHVHLDHCGGVAGLAKLYPEAEVLAHPQAVKHLVSPDKLIESVKRIYGPEIMKLFGDVEPVQEDRVRAVADGEVLGLGRCELTFIYTPGHAPHQISIFESSSQSVVTADAVPAQYPDFPAIIPTTPPPSFDLDQYINSMRKLGGLGARFFLTPHYGPTDPSGERVRRMVERTVMWVEAFRDEMDAGKVIQRLRKTLEEEAGRPIPAYADNLIRISALGILRYLGRRQLF
ncbi:Flavo-diiron protein FprA1 [archaeon HR01]|nr:Flavo-diiron protein FprA1 [archaeon HR01]